MQRFDVKLDGVIILQKSDEMAKYSQISYDQVSDACHALFKDGGSLAFDSVYTAIGRRGSAKIVQDFIAQWKKETAEKLYTQRTNPDLPAALIGESDQLIAGLWKRALADADAAYQAKTDELVVEREKLTALVDAADERVRACDATNSLLSSDLRAAQSEITHLEDSLVERDNRLSAAAASLSAKDEQVSALREDHARLATTLDSERARHTADLATERLRHDEERARHEGELENVRAQHLADQARAADIAQGERQFLMAQTDSIRTAARQKEEHLAELLATEKLYSAGYKSQAYQARDDLAKAQGRMELLGEQLETALARVDAAERAQIELEKQKSLTLDNKEMGSGTK